MKSHFIVLVASIILLVNNSIGEPIVQNESYILENIYHRETMVLYREYIVVYHRYYDLAVHENLLVNILGTQEWNIIERNLPYDQSDFSLIEISCEYENRILSLLKHTPIIKGVYPQKRLGESLKQTQLIDQEYSKFKFDINFEDHEDLYENQSIGRDVKVSKKDIQSLFEENIFLRGYTGKGVKVGIFDTGLRDNHPHFRNISSRTDWTYENEKDDVIGHGTFVAGIVAGSGDCKGLAPDTEIYSFRMFSSKKASYTSWFLDAFNFAILRKLNILNLSIGGPDFLDEPFVDKIVEMTANNIIIVSAMGNDGPVFGSTNNPADQLEVIGVGGIGFNDLVSDFSSRGMTHWELSFGSGRFKPEIVTYGETIYSSATYNGCRQLSGTSVSAPVVTGAISLLASSIPEEIRWDIINPASIKQILIGGASRIQGGIFEQGSGKLNISNSLDYMTTYKPHITTFPSDLNLSDCTYMWPYCAQPLYYSSMAIVLNVTILNPISVQGYIYKEPVFYTKSNILNVTFSYQELIWPWTGYLGVHVNIAKPAVGRNIESGIIHLYIMTKENGTEVAHEITIPLSINVIPTPNRAKRILWDQYHNIQYPLSYIPSDTISSSNNFDLNGDHPYTNFRSFYNDILKRGYYLEVLTKPLTCFNASNYGALMIVDSEDVFFEEEIDKLIDDIENKDLSIVVLADWYDDRIIMKSRFYDENSKVWRFLTSGGANIPAINRLLKKYGISLGGNVYEGLVSILNFGFKSGSPIIRFPKEGYLASFTLKDKSAMILDNVELYKTIGVLGFYQVKVHGKPKGKILVYGDSSPIDDAHRVYHTGFLDIMLAYVNKGVIPSVANQLEEDYKTDIREAIEINPSMISSVSKVIGKRVNCDNYTIINEEKSISEQHLFEVVLKRVDVKVPHEDEVFSNFVSIIIMILFIFGVIAILYKRKQMFEVESRTIV